MNWTTDQVKVLSKELRAAFDEEALEQMLYFELNVKLWEIVKHRPFETVVFELLVWAQARGTLDELATQVRHPPRGGWKLFRAPKQLTTAERRTGLPAGR
jgi:hypothetical protein